jgi:hypothetical protein
MLETGQLNFTSTVRTIANSSNADRLKKFRLVFPTFSTKNNRPSVLLLIYGALSRNSFRPEEISSQECKPDERRGHAFEAVQGTFNQAALVEDEVDLPKRLLRKGDLLALLAVPFLGRGDVA